MDNPSLRDDLLGTTIGGRFELIALAGQGGMGRVYRARDRETERLAAIKMLVDASDTARLLREAAVLAGIDHPGVVRYLDHGHGPGGAPFLAMEWLTGEDLARRLEQRTLTVDQALVVAKRAAAALAAAHTRGIVHRDLKPANLFLVGGNLEDLKLLDFGVAYATGDVEITSAGTLVGTPSYMSPEQVKGEHVDARADVYGLGAVLYRCLTGHPPFVGEHRLAVLAKILLEAAPQIRDVSPDVPEEIEAFIDRLLTKDRERRPSDGGAVLDMLNQLGSPVSSHRGRARAVIGAQEERVASVILCARSSSEDDTLVGTLGGGIHEAVRGAVEGCGGVIDALSKGAWVITIPNAATPEEQATRAARCALALSGVRPRVPVFVATGRVLVTGRQRVGKVIDQAVDAFVRDSGAKHPGGVRVDRATAELLEVRFRTSGDGDWLDLMEEKDTVAPVRTLLGKPAPCVGREPQLAMLTSMLEASMSDSRSGAALVTAAPGLGKTRLLHEFLRAGLESSDDRELIFASADAMRAGSAFGVAGEMLKREAGIVDSDVATVRGGKLEALVARDFGSSAAPLRAELLGEICGVLKPHERASEALRAARADVAVMADSIRETWREWLQARSSRAGVVLVVENLHWADATSIRLIESALVALEDRRIFWLATSRPGGTGVVSAHFRARGLVEMSLAPLSKQAAERLVRGALGNAHDPDAVREIVQRGAGHPFHLEELVRAVAAGRGTDVLPDSVLGMVQARLDDLDSKSRMLLRAASVFGERFSALGVAALMGDDVAISDIERVLGSFVARELLTQERGSKWQGQIEFRFRHALLRDGTYATLAERDRERAHRRAASWLEASGATDPAVLAEHCALGADPEKAISFFRIAAAQALQHNDLDRALSHAERAREYRPDAQTMAALEAIEAEVLYWRGELTSSAERGTEASKSLTKGSEQWFEAVSVTLGALGQLGRNEQVAERLVDVADATSPPESRGAHIVALCRGLTQLFWAHHGGGLPKVRARLDALVRDTVELDAYYCGWVHRVRGESAWLHEGNVGRCLRELDASCREFERASALRALCLTRLNAASLAGWSGDVARAKELLVLSRAEASRLGTGFLLHYAQAVEGLILAYAGDPSAEDVMRAAGAVTAGSPRLEFVCRVVVGSLALGRGDILAAEIEERAARELKVAPELGAARLALASRLARTQGALPEAIRLGRDAVMLESASSDLELTYGMAGTALAESLAAAGDHEGAARALEPLRARLNAIAESMSTADQRERFWSRPLSNAELRVLT